MSGRSRPPIYFTVGLPEGTLDWTPVLLEGLRTVSIEVRDVREANGILTIETANSRHYIPVTIRARRVPEGILLYWEYSDVKAIGLTQRVGSAFGEDVNRFILAFAQHHHLKGRAVSPEVGAARMGLPYLPEPLPSMPASSGPAAGRSAKPASPRRAAAVNEIVVFVAILIGVFLFLALWSSASISTPVKTEATILGGLVLIAGALIAWYLKAKKQRIEDRAWLELARRR